MNISYFCQVDLRNRGQKCKTVDKSPRHDENVISVREADECPSDGHEDAGDQDDFLSTNRSGKVTRKN